MPDDAGSHCNSRTVEMTMQFDEFTQDSSRSDGSVARALRRCSIRENFYRL